MGDFNRKDYLRASKKAKMDQKFEGIQSKIKDAYVIRKNLNFEDLDQKYETSVSSDYHCINWNTVVVQDKATEEMFFVVKFLPFDEMTIEEYEEYSKITSTLISAKKGASHIKVNGPLKCGDMYGIGWRAGRDGRLKFGRYVPNTPVQQKRSSLYNWEEQQILLSEVSYIYGKHFCKLAPSIFEHVKAEHQSVEVPSLSQTEFNILHAEENAFASNLTYTINDFSNCFHKDNDFNSYSFGIWAPTSFGDLKSKKNDFKSKGGEFLLGSYKICVDLNVCDGIVEMIWRSNQDFHCTIPSETSGDYTRIGSSVQISNALVNKMKKIVIEHKKGKNIRENICGVNEIMQLKLKKAKQ